VSTATGVDATAIVALGAGVALAGTVIVALGAGVALAEAEGVAVAVRSAVGVAVAVACGLGVGVAAAWVGRALVTCCVGATLVLGDEQAANRARMISKPGSGTARRIPWERARATVATDVAPRRDRA